MSRQEAYEASALGQVAEAQNIPWWVSLTQGIFLIIIGILLFTNTAATVLVMAQILAIYWLISGILQIVSIFVHHSAWGWKLLGGIIGIWAGLFIINNPIGGTLAFGFAVVVILGIQAMILGVINIIQAFRGSGWGIGLLGIVNIIFGLILLGNTMFSVAVLPWILGGFAFIGGMAAIFIAFRSREYYPSHIHGYRIKPRNWALTITHPTCLAKGSSSSFIASVHPQTQHLLMQLNATNKLKAIGVKGIETNSFGFEKTDLSLVVVRLESPHISFFPSEGVTLDITQNNDVFQTDFVAVPKKDAPARRPDFVRASLTAKETGEEITAGLVKVKIDDFLVDSISRPIVANVVATISTVFTVALWILAFLEQIDKTFGFTVGAASLFIAGVLGLGTYFRYSSTTTTNIH